MWSIFVSGPNDIVILSTLSVFRDMINEFYAKNHPRIGISINVLCEIIVLYMWPIFVSGPNDIDILGTLSVIGNVINEFYVKNYPRIHILSNFPVV